VRFEKRPKSKEKPFEMEPKSHLFLQLLIKGTQGKYSDYS